MDPLMLEAVVTELAELLPGQPLGEALQLDSHRFLLRFDAPPFPRLHVALHPRLSTLHLARRVAAPDTTTDLAAGLTRALAGRTVEAIARHPAGRVVLLDFTGGARLVVELLGRANNLYLLDASGRVERQALEPGGEFRRLGEGAVWEPPPVPAHGVAGSLLLQHEAAFAQAQAEPADSVLAEIHERLAGRRWSPTLHLPAPLERLGEAEPLSGRNLFAFPLPLRHAPGLERIPFDTANEAEAAATECMLRHLAFVSLRSALSAQVRHERKRLDELRTVLADEMSRATEASSTSRRQAEILLAGISQARREGSSVRVPDCYDPEGGEVLVPIDPRLGLQENATRLFRRAKRAARSLEMIPPRIQALSGRVGALDDAQGRIEGASSRAGLEALEKELQGARLVRAFRKPARADVAARAEYVPVREFRTADGFTVLVGRSSADNDHLTFQVAAPHDLWLHAAGWPGAHVIVRNPRRLAELPEMALRDAAGIAAWFCRGKEEGQLDVHYTFRRHVRKGKGMSPGKVMMKRHRTIRVAPQLPAGSGPLD